MGVSTVVFLVLLKAFEIEHYPLFILSGLLSWVFFQSAVQMPCSSLFAQLTLVKQVRFPRHMLPLAVVATNVVTLGAMFGVVLVANLIVIPETSTTFWAAVPLLVPLIALAAGLGVIVSYVTVVYRDVEHLLLTIFLPWFFLTPVFYNFDRLPGLQDRRCLTSVHTGATSSLRSFERFVTRCSSGCGRELSTSYTACWSLPRLCCWASWSCIAWTTSSPQRCSDGRAASRWKRTASRPP
jgi:hypothetical protein